MWILVIEIESGKETLISQIEELGFLSPNQNWFIR